MLDFQQARQTKFSAAWVGDANRYEVYVVPQATLTPVTDLIEEITTVTMLKPFSTSEEFWYLYPGDELATSPVFDICFDIFDNHDSLSANAGKLAAMLYETCTNPKVQGGEFFVSIFEDILLNGEPTQAIGLWKVQSKNPYIGTERKDDQFRISVLQGIPTSKLEVAALIFNLDENDGYRVFAVDTVSKKSDRSFWKDDFLRLRPIEDDYFNTRHYMSAASEFITGKAPFKFGLDRPTVFDMLVKAGDYFKDNEEFEINDFSKAVMLSGDMQEAFVEYVDEYSKAYAIPLQLTFNISGQAVKKEMKLFKTTLKLDKNFVLQVKGRVDLLERGLDEEKGMKFYKVYFETED